jgi:hypothetical protein
MEMENSMVLLFPNPFHTAITLQLESIAAKSELLIFNSMGMPVKKIQIQFKETAISREGFSNGIYFYQLIVPGKTLMSGKLMIE